MKNMNNATAEKIRDKENRRKIMRSTLFFLLALSVLPPALSALDVVDARISWFELQVKLDRPIQASSINEDNLYLLNNKGRLERRIEVSPDGTLLTVFIRKSYLHRPFVLVMTPALQDSAGQSLSRGFIKVFNVLIHPLWQGKASWLIRVSENPRIEIEDLRRRIFTCNFPAFISTCPLFRFPLFSLGHFFWNALEDEIPPGGFVSSFRLRSQAAVDDESLTDMHVEDISGLCHKLPPHMGFINVPPQITISGVADGLVTRGDVQANIQVRDKNLFFSYNFLNFGLYQSGTLIQAENSYWLFVIAVDKGLKFSYKFLRFAIDKTPPRIIRLVPGEDFRTDKPNLVISGEVEGADKVTVNGAETPLADGKFQTASLLLAPGPNPFLVVASDRAGNTDQRSFTATFIKDGNPPEIKIKSPLDGSFLNTPLVNVSGTVTDESAVVKVLVNGNPAVLQGSNFFFEGLALEQGLNSIVVEAEDEAGNKSSATAAVTLDNIPPQIIVASPAADSYSKDRNILVRGQVKDASAVSLLVQNQAVPVTDGSFSQTLDLPEGRQDISFEATDKAGNKSTASVTVIVDLTPPVISLASPLENDVIGTSSVPLNGKIQDANPYKIRINAIEGRVIGTSFYLEGLPLEEGPNQVVIEAEDRAGNSSQKTLAIMRDTTPPQITITSPPQNLLSSQTVLEVKGSVMDASAVEVRVNEVAAQVANQEYAAFIPLAEGLNMIKAVARDKAGNTAATHSNIQIDTTPPLITLTSPRDGEIFHAPAIQVAGRISESNFQSLKLNGQETPLSGDAFTAALSLKEGENKIALLAEDRVGLRSSIEVSVFLDTTVPRIVSVLPADNAADIPTQISVEVVFSEDMAATTLTPETFFVSSADGRKIQGTIAAGAKKAVFTPEAALPDSRTLYIDLTSGIQDTAGNNLANPYHGKFATKDMTPPPPPALDPLPDKTGLTVIAVSGTAESLAHIEIEGGAVKVSCDADANGRFSSPATLNPNALNQFAVTAADAAGNRSLPATASVYQDSGVFEALDAEFSSNRVLVTFSRIPDSRTLIAETFYLMSQNGREGGSIAVQADGKAVFNPTQNLTATPFLLTVTRGVKDLDGKILAFEYTKMFNQSAGDCFIQGEVYNDSNGQPLEGAIVQLLSSNGVPAADPKPTTITSKQGKYALACPSGKLVIRIAKEGHTVCERVIVSTSGFSSELLDVRLTPQNNAPAAMAAEGGTLFIENPEIRLIYPEGAVAGEAISLKITPVSGQGLRERLPYGWSPLAVVDISPSESAFLKPCALKVKTDYALAPDQKLAFSRWDEVNAQWVALFPPVFASPYLEATIDRTGQYAFLLADSAPVSPADPMPGEPLPRVTPPAIPAIEKTQLTFTPDEIFPDERSRGALVIEPKTPISSGVPVQAVVSENYELLSSAQVALPAYTADLVSYNYGGIQSRVDFYVSPNQEIAFTSLKIGTIDTDMRRYFASETGMLIGPDGGTVAGEGGAEIVIEPNSVSSYIPVAVKSKNPATIVALAPQDFRLLGALELSLGGYSLKTSAAISLPLTEDVVQSLGDEPQLLAARLEQIEGDTVWHFIQTAKISDLKAVSHKAAEAFLPLKGVVEGGTYVFLGALSPLGYIRGTVSDQGQPLPNAVVRINTQSLQTISLAGGAYGQASFLGQFEVAALNLGSRDTGKTADAVSTKAEVKTIDIAIAATGPEVISVTPSNAAAGVPVETKVEVIFSEPVKASSFNAQNFYLLQAEAKIEGVYKLSSDGRRGELAPAKALASDTLIAAILTTGIQDLSSNPMASGFTWSFRTKDVTPPKGDPSLIMVIIPANGISRIIGRPGAVEPGASVAIINPETGETVTLAGNSDGSFDTQIAASIRDRLIIRIIDNAGNKTELAPGPFRSEDGLSAVLGPEAVAFVTPQGIGMKVEAGTFSGPVVARIVEETNPLVLAPLSQKFQRMKAVQVDLGGAVPMKPLKLSAAAPPSVTPQTQCYLGREVYVFGEKKLMVVDTTALKNGRLETNSPPWPGCYREGLYSFLYANSPYSLGLLGGPLLYPFCAVYAGEFVFVADTYTSMSRFIIPVGVSEEYTLKVRALDTGEVFYEGKQTGPSSASEAVEFKENITGDKESPLLLSTALANTICFELAGIETQSQGVKVTASDGDGNGLPDKNGAVSIAGDEYAADPNGLVRIYNLTAKTSPLEIRADDKGKFSAGITASFKDNILIALPKGNIPANQVFTFGFSEPLKDPSEIEKKVMLKEVLDSGEYQVHGQARLLDSKTEVEFVPDSGLMENTTYRFVLSGLSDAAENAIPEIKIDFRTKISGMLDFTEIQKVYDSLLLGSILVVASAEEGLKLYDVSDPTNMVPLSTLFLPRASGLAIDSRPAPGTDPKDRLIVVGGGETSGGYIKIVDISDPRNPVQIGSQKITERVGFARSFTDAGLIPPRTILPEAFPRRVVVLSGYAFVGTYGGGFQIIDTSKIKEATTSQEGLILTMNLEDPTIADLAAFQDDATQSTYLIAAVYGKFKGLKLYDATNPGGVMERANFPSPRSIQKIQMALGYPYDIDNDGEIEESEKRDLLFASSPGDRNIRLLDISDRYFKYLGEVSTPDEPHTMAIDRRSGVLYVHAGEQLLYIDIRDLKRWENPDYMGLLDANSDGLDDRIMGQVKMKSGICQSLSIDENLKIAYVGNFDQGVELVRVDPPRIEIVQDLDGDGVYEAAEGVLPFGIEKDAAGKPIASPRNNIYLTAFFPSVKRDAIAAALWSVSFEGDPLPDWGQVKTRLASVMLRRQSSDPRSEKYNFFVSDRIQVTADPKSSFAGEKLLSGDYLRAALSPDLSDLYTKEVPSSDGTTTTLKYYVSKEELIQGFDYVKSVRAEYVDSEKPEPLNNPSAGSGEPAGAVYLHSGEFEIEAVDLRLAGRGFDFELRRTFQSQSIYSGPLGWNWDHSYNRRLLELPDGSLVYFDGAGRRETFPAERNEAGIILKYKIPAGYFLEVYRRADGSTTLRDAQGGIMIFNALGRLVKLMDRNANYMEFSYDLSGKLSLAIDTMGRLIRFDYYPYQADDMRSCRLREVTDFTGRKVVYSYDERGDLKAADFEGRITRYAYTEGADLDAEHNLRSVTDPNGQTAVEVSYDGEDKVIGQKKGGVSISVSSGQSATTTDGRGVTRLYTHDDKGHPLSITEGGFATAYAYNQDGLITRITYPLGNSVEYSYDSGNAERRSQSNLLSELRIPDGRGGEPLQTTYTYDPSSNAVKSIIDPKGNRIEFTLDDRGNVIASQYPENAAYLFEYNSFGQKVKETLPNGSVTAYEYYPESSPSGGASSVTGRDVDPSTGGYLKQAVRDASGDKLSSHFIYDARGNVTEETSEQGVKSSYSIDDYDQATSRTVVGTVGQAAAPIQAIFSYDQNGNLVMHSEQNITTTYTYNSRNLMESMTRTAGDVTQAFTFGYDESGNRSSIAYPKGNGDAFVYNNRNLLQTKTEGALTTTTYGYDGNGNLTSILDGAGKTTTYAFDGLDRQAFTADPLGNKIEYTRDRNSNVTQIAGRGADGAQTVVQNSYDALDRMTTRQVGTSVSRYGYNTASHLVSVENPNNRAWSFGRSGTGLLKQSDDPAGNSDAMGYTAGTLTSVSEREAGGKTLDRSMMRDGFGSVVKEADSAGREQRYIYNANQRLESTGDAEGGAVSFERDGLGRVTKEIRHLTYGAETRQYETIYRYDPNGNLASVTDAKGNATSYEYDAKDRLTKITYADSSFESFVYDGNDRLSVYTDQNGTVITNTYDDAGRLVRRDIAKAAGVAGSSFEAFSYDGLGRIIRAENDVSVVEYSYDDQGRITNEKQNGKDVGSAYDANGNKTTLTYPSGKVVNYEYDALDRIAFIRSEARQIAAYGYEGKGKVTTKTVGDALKMDAMFDQGRRPAALSFKNVTNNKTIVDQAMGWNRVDLKMFEKKQDENGKGNRYAYDSLYRLRQVKENMADPENAGGAGEKETSYDIDGVENVVARVDKEKGVDNTASFTIDNRNRITSYKGETLTYDVNGNLQGFKGDQYIYDWKNQLVQVNTANGNVVVLNYDALGRRIGKIISGNNALSIRYIYDGWRIIEERDGSDVVKARYSHGNGIDELVEIEKAAAIPGQYDRYYPAQGTNGSVLAVTDANGEIAEKVNYSAYGKPVFVYDHAGPEVDAIRVEAGNIFIRFSEAVKRDKAQSALKVKIGADVITGSITFEDKDRLAKFTPSSAIPTNGELSVEVGDTLEDLAGNKIAAAVVKSTPYTGADVMVFDRTSPSVESVKIVGNAVLVEFNEEIKAESVAGGIELKRGTNIAAGDTTLENPNTVKFTATSAITPSVEYVIIVKSTIKDLSGKALASDNQVTFTYSGNDDILFAKPDPDQQSKSYIGNPYLFQGREFDAETNLYYFRARYLHPELGRFLQPDPKGYVDSMNVYQSFGNNPANFLDPMGFAKKIALILGLAPGERNPIRTFEQPDNYTAPDLMTELMEFFRDQNKPGMSISPFTYYEKAPINSDLFELAEKKGITYKVFNTWQLWEYNQKTHSYERRPYLYFHDGEKSIKYSLDELLQDPEWAVVFVGHIGFLRGERAVLGLSNPTYPFEDKYPVYINPPKIKNEIFLPLGCDSISLKLKEGSTLSGGVLGKIAPGSAEKAAYAFVREYVNSEDFDRALDAAKIEYNAIRQIQDTGVIIKRVEKR